MRLLLLPVALALVAAPALAQNRPSTLDMTCGQAQGVVASHGAVVLGTGGHTFDRFVAGVGFCPFDQYAEPVWVPTLDTRQCPIGYVCRHRYRRLHED